VPVTPCGKRPLTPNGLNDATADAEIVRGWYDLWPDANLGVRTGACSGIIVLDIDPKAGGTESLRQLEKRHGRLPATLTVATGGGGEHCYFSHPGGEVRNSAGRLGPGLDVRGDGGYVVAPPSVHECGKPYRWLSDPQKTPIAEAPRWLLELLASPAPRQASVPEPIDQGCRSHTLTSMAGSMRRRGMGEAAIRAALLEENAARCRPPLPETEVARIAKSVSRYPAGDAAGRDPRLADDDETVSADRQVALIPLDELLEGIGRFVARFVVLTPQQLAAVALWVVHTYVLEAFDMTPYPVD
jgi:hypothetical protein